jgi:hypothetical protein
VGKNKVMNRVGNFQTVLGEGLFGVSRMTFFEGLGVINIMDKSGQEPVFFGRFFRTEEIVCGEIIIKPAQTSLKSQRMGIDFFIQLSFDGLSIFLVH